MRLASSLVAFIFLGVAAAGVVPIAARDLGMSNGDEGIHNAPLSGVPPHPSGFPADAPPQCGTPVSPMGSDPTPIHLLPLTMPGAPDPHSIIPCAASDHPAPSAHPPALRRAQPIDGHSPTPASHIPGADSTSPAQPTTDIQPHPSGLNPSGTPKPPAQPSDGLPPLPAPHTPSITGTPPFPPSQPTPAMPPHRSDLPPGVSGYPLPSVIPGDGPKHISDPPKPMMSPA